MCSTHSMIEEGTYFLSYKQDYLFFTGKWHSSYHCRNIEAETSNKE